MNDWRDIEGYEGMYQINIGGHIKSLPRTVKPWHTGIPSHVRSCIIKPQFCTKTGERIANLSKNGNVTRFYVRKLVIKAFPNKD